jgi:hypothetical protein
MALPKLNDAGELTEKSEEESPSSLTFWVVGVGEVESLRFEGSSSSQNIVFDDPRNRRESSF